MHTEEEEQNRTLVLFKLDRSVEVNWRTQNTTLERGHFVSRCQHNPRDCKELELSLRLSAAVSMPEFALAKPGCNV